MIIKPSRFKRAIRYKLMGIFNRIENNNDCNFETNGEKIFLENLFVEFSKDKERKRVLFDVGANIGKYFHCLCLLFEEYHTHFLYVKI